MIGPRPIPRANPLSFFLIGLTILAASTWVFVLILHSVYGRFDLADIMPTRINLRTVFDQGRAGILESTYSDRLLPDGSTWLHDNVSAWKRFLHSIDADFTVLDDHTIESGNLQEYSVLILPGSRALSDIEIDKIKTFVDRGGRVFATGGTGTFSENGQWRGWDFLSQVFGLQFTREITPDQTTKAHTLRGALPITAGIPSGYALRVATWDNPIACKVVEPRTTQASTWYNFRSDSGLTRESIESTAGIAYGTYGSGRFIWMGFELNSVLGEQKDYVYFDLLCRRCMDWLLGRPTAFVRDWPAGSTAAALIVLPKDTAAYDVPSLRSAFEGRGVPVSPFGEPDGRQWRTSGTLQYSDGSTQHSLSGILAFAGRSGPSDVQQYLAAGCDFIVLDSVSDRAVPEAVTDGGRTAVVFSKTARGDNEIVESYGLKDTALQFYTYREDIDRVLFQGGLYVVQLHDALQGRPDYVPVAGQIASYLKARSVWTATASAIARWWMSRSALTVNVQQRSNRRIALVVSNTSRNPIGDVVIQLNMNRKASDVTLTSDILGTTIPEYHFNPKTETVEITIRVLNGGTSLSLFVDYDQPSV